MHARPFSRRKAIPRDLDARAPRPKLVQVATGHAEASAGARIGPLHGLDGEASGESSSRQLQHLPLRPPRGVHAEHDEEAPTVGLGQLHLAERRRTRDPPAPNGAPRAEQGEPLRGGEREMRTCRPIVLVSRIKYPSRRIGACRFVTVGRLVANISRGVVQQPDRLYRLSIFAD